MKTYWVSIMTNRSRTLYTGVTGDLPRRVYEHRHRVGSRLTSEYHIDRLVLAEPFLRGSCDAIAREKHIKGWVRSRKLAPHCCRQPELA